MENYLVHSEHIDWKHPQVSAKAAELALGCLSDEAVAKRCFEFVKDFPVILAEPHPAVVKALTQYKTVEQVFENLPDVEMIC